LQWAAIGPLHFIFFISIPAADYPPPELQLRLLKPGPSPMGSWKEISKHHIFEEETGYRKNDNNTGVTRLAPPVLLIFFFTHPVKINLLIPALL
jgi:hypothetical protein